MTCGKRIKYVTLLFGILFVGALIYYYLPFKLEYSGNMHKVWAHRVNSIEKLNYTQKRYVGIELDILYDESSGTFDVTHPPAESINLTLETYLSHWDTNQKASGLWLDFKNLNVSNYKKSLLRLIHLTEKFQLEKNKIIVESQHPQFLKDFEKAGFITSYYLPSELLSLNEEQLSKKITEINRQIISFPTSALSTNIDDYEIIAKYFPDHKKLLWSLHSTLPKKGFKNYALTKKALNDKTVEVLLVRVNRRIGHR